MNVFLGEVSVQVLCSFLNWTVSFNVVEFSEFLIYLYINILLEMLFANIFSHSVGDFFVLLMISFAVQKLFGFI